MYRFYNPNPEGKRVGDCVIRALTKVLGGDWTSNYMDVCLQGGVDYDMPSSNAVWGHLLRRKGFLMHALPHCPDCYTVREFCRDNPRGEYILGTGSHVVAAVDGDYYDAWDSGNEVLTFFYSR